MSHPIAPGTYRIVSLLEGNHSVGVPLGRAAMQTVYLGARFTNCHVNEAGNDTYRIGIGAYAYTSKGPHEDEVFATTHPQQNVEWHFTYRESQNAYTIDLATHRRTVWTVNEWSQNRIEVNTLILVRPWEYPLNQLFRFVQIDDAEEGSRAEDPL